MERWNEYILTSTPFGAEMNFKKERTIEYTNIPAYKGMYEGGRVSTSSAYRPLRLVQELKQERIVAFVKLSIINCVFPPQSQQYRWLTRSHASAVANTSSQQTNILVHSPFIKCIESSLKGDLVFEIGDHRGSMTSRDSMARARKVSSASSTSNVSVRITYFPPLAFLDLPSYPSLSFEV